jgi:hypothetical protein
MLEMKEATVGIRDRVQAIELSLLVELEAQWENLRASRPQDTLLRSTMQDLQSRQRAYEAFRAKLAAYNKRYTPAHVPEVLLNTPSRLGTWCRAMRDLYLQVEREAQGRCPVYLIEKAYRWADRVGSRLKRDRISRTPPSSTIQGAIQELEALVQWCEDLAKAAPKE